jgi:DNA repair ATPase RecN
LALARVTTMKARRAWGRGVAAWAALALCAFGCGEQKKIKECNSLINVINSGVDKIQKNTSVTPDGGTPVVELRALADEMDGIAAEAAKVELTQPELKKLAERYQSMAGEVAVSARELAAAVDKVDVDEMQKAQSRMDKAVKLEDPLVDEINRFCRSP